MCSGASLPLNVFGNVLVMTTPGYSFFTHGPWLLNVALVRFGFLAPTLTTVGPVHGAYSAKPAGYSGAMSASLPADATMTTPPRRQVLQQGGDSRLQIGFGLLGIPAEGHRDHVDEVLRG